MQHARTVLLILLLLAGSLSPPCLRAQESRDGPRAQESQDFWLEQNYPNPVNPETWIPFHLEDRLFEAGDSAVVTIRIFNILRQVVAIAETVDHSSGRRTRVINLPYKEAGRKVAYWDGKDSAGRRVPSGVYYCQLVVNDQPRTRKMIVLNPRRRRNFFPWFGDSQEERPR